MNSALFPDLIVNGEKIPHAIVANETQNHDAPSGKPGIAWRKAANAVAIRTLLLQEAKALALVPDPIEVGPGQYETDEEALIRGLLDEAVDVGTPKDEDIVAEWEKDPERFRAPPLWEVSHILCAADPRDKAANDKAMHHAESLSVLVAANPKAFADIAAKESDCGSKLLGGALGQLGPGDTVPEFEAVLRHLVEGEVTNAPVQTRHGWHIIRMDAVAKGEVLPFQVVRQKITKAMEKAEWASNARVFVKALVESAEIQGADFKPI